MATNRIDNNNSKDDDVIKFAASLIDFAVRGKLNSGIVEKYNKSINYVCGNQKAKENTSREGKLVWNKYAELFKFKIADIANAEIKWNFEPIGNEDIFLSTALNKIIGDIVFEFSEWEDKKKEKSILEAAHAGSSFIKTLVDINSGLPNFVVTPLKSIFPDPIAKSSEELRYIIHFIIKSVKEIKRDYDVEVQAEQDLDNLNKVILNVAKYGFEHENPTTYQMPSNIPKLSSKETLLPDEVSDKIGKTLLAEIWVEDLTSEKIPYKPEETELEHAAMTTGVYPPVLDTQNHLFHVRSHSLKLKSLDSSLNSLEYQMLSEHIEKHEKYDLSETRRKYPLGRVITICQNKLLRDEPNPLPIHWHNVFIKWDWDIIPDQFYGKGLGVDYFDPQDAFNHRKNAITININNLNSGITKIKRNIFQTIFGQNKKVMTNMSGYGIPVNDMNDVVRDYGPSLPTHVMTDLYHTEQFINQQAQSEGVLAGQYPKGSPPDATIQRLLYEGKKPIQNVLKHYAQALKQMGKNALMIMDAFLPEETRFKIIGDDKNAQMIQWKDLKEHGGLYDIKVTVKTILNTERQEELQRAIGLKREGVYDAIAVLNVVDDPQKFDVIERMDQVAQLQMAVKGLLEQVDMKDKQINTFMNRSQEKGKEGAGNVGTEKTTR